ncbi:hypothetical protein [Clostridium lacusfryxellense]|uniref:hypothetical protein n=1 Tax=Clostridium lacusfryxellense TaxID=205328 RepID=UPI001C0C2D26|nr:hypothetical protein [Clostridium lacusfryxellense]MBU3112981.1 hypothetical protein [Clostridium lacusfryxellense]
MDEDTFFGDTFNEHNGLFIEFMPDEVIKQLDVDISMGDYTDTPPIVPDLTCSTSLDDI